VGRPLVLEILVKIDPVEANTPTKRQP